MTKKQQALQEQLNAIEKQKQDIELQRTKLAEEQLNIKKDLVKMEGAKMIELLDENAQVSQAPLFDFPLNEQNIQNGNFNTNLNIMAQADTMQQTDKYSNDFLAYLLVLRRANYFANRIKIIGANFDDVELIKAVLYYGALYGAVAVTDKRELIAINSIKSTEITGQLINYKGYEDITNNKTIKARSWALYEFNPSRFGLWVIAWAYLQKVSKYLGLLDTQSKYLIKQLIVKVNREDINARNDILKENLFTQATPFLQIDKDVELAPLNNPADNLQTIFNFVENYQNWFDKNLLYMNVKDITSDKERDVASQQSNFANVSIVDSNFLNWEVEKFLYQFAKLFDLKNLDYEDLTTPQLEAQAHQSLTLAKLNDNEEKEKNNDETIQNN